MRLPSPTAAEVGVAAALSSQVVVYLIIESTCVTSRRAFIWTESRSEEHTSELQSQPNLVCRLLLEKKKKKVRPDQHDSVLHGWSSDAVAKLPDVLPVDDAPPTPLGDRKLITTGPPRATRDHGAHQL